MLYNNPKHNNNVTVSKYLMRKENECSFIWLWHHKHGPPSHPLVMAPQHFVKEAQSQRFYVMHAKEARIYSLHIAGFDCLRQ
ncbi:hypothetical protein SLEP1_g8373 [Rubroshorea leprosula]|uniref:Uncharacterized protein n=1 Tax=Rubroshorea leprosula TaxID=152421 RepID=A0AAV5IAR4_9ROSI|nr:hypothetical protein SLEP1_g8373 [Rubroshorea leprosula]